VELARLLRAAEHGDDAAADVALGIARDARDLRAAAALRHDLGAQPDLLGAALDQVVAREAGEPGEEVGRLLHGEEALRRLGAVALGDAGDDRFLGRKVAVEIAGAHLRLGADLLHRGLMEAGADETAFRRVEDFGPAVSLQLDVGVAHGFCGAVKANERSLLHPRTLTVNSPWLPGWSRHPRDGRGSWRGWRGSGGEPSRIDQAAKGVQREEGNLVAADAGLAKAALPMSPDRPRRNAQFARACGGISRSPATRSMA